MQGFDLSRGEKARLSCWLAAIAFATFAWNLYLWRVEADDAATWLLPAIIASCATLGVLGGIFVPRRRTSWASAVGATCAGAGTIAGACFLTFVAINGAEGGPDNPFALGVGAAFLGGAGFVVLAPSFGIAYAIRTMVTSLVGSR